MSDVRFELAGRGGSDGDGAGIGNVDERFGFSCGAGESRDENRELEDATESRFAILAEREGGTKEEEGASSACGWEIETSDWSNAVWERKATTFWGVFFFGRYGRGHNKGVYR